MVRLRLTNTRGRAGMPAPVSPGTKMSRECKVCGSPPYVRCVQFRSGKYTGQQFEQDWDPLNGGYSVPLKRPHKDR